MSLRLSSKLSPCPYGAIGIATYTNVVEIIYDEDAKGVELDLNGTKLSSEPEIVLAIAKAAGLADDSAKSTSFFDLAKTLSASSSGVPEILTCLDTLDDHLAWRTFLVGHSITPADWLVWGAIRSTTRSMGLLKNNKHVHLVRWQTYFETLESTQGAYAALTAAKASKTRNTKTAAGFQIGLKDAKMGEVVTRFPPEPSGYLHIGHAKAAILNQYFAKMYDGKLIIRFDDTNPTVERSEFEETILEDLRLLDIHGDIVSHSSDYFDQLYEIAVKLIKDGKAYADDTPHSEMKEKRWHGLPSARRDASVEENLKHFDEMKSGSEEGQRWCIRAKISVDNPNKALRDPVIYRVNLTHHHRTGDKWKIYPTYDFACPAVDAIEGVTHALRTNEYRDRHPQYDWMLQATGLRHVHMWDFSRLNFIYTLLSKRKLRWFVETGIVRGWDDPRFPTVRGIRRRGMTVEALRQFMLSQGPSQSVVSLEWDSIWSNNKKIIDPITPRHWAILETNMVPVTVNGAPKEQEVKTLPKHKKNDALGTKKTVFWDRILIEQEDAKSFDDQEEITLMDWGNAIVRKVTKDESTGVISAIEMDLHLEGDFRKTKKKITWLAQPAPPADPLIPITLVDHDYLITKKKLDDEDEPVDFLSPASEFRQEALADANVVDLKKGDLMQFERKGYFMYDGESSEGKKEFILIPDGRAGSVASKAVEGGYVDPAVQKVRDAAAANPKVPAKAKQEDEPVSKMYKVAPLVNDEVSSEPASKMYKVARIH
ncbi:tRNA synthetases class I, catalytic domain-containing protein [Flagelloscypha sp. PMI_526]|nr:tRNA synthetases class I, catalytic domain-containing protein [Flagelloscypha sp. PMI_526]